MELQKRLNKTTPEDILDLVFSASAEKMKYVPFVVSASDASDFDMITEIVANGHRYKQKSIGYIRTINCEDGDKMTHLREYQCDELDGWIHPNEVYSTHSDLIREGLRVHYNDFSFDPCNIQLEDDTNNSKLCTELNRMCKNAKFSVASPKYGDARSSIHTTFFIPYTACGVSRRIPQDIEVTFPYFSKLAFLKVYGKLLKQPSVHADGFTKNLVVNAKNLFGSDSISEQTMRYMAQYIDYVAEKYDIIISIRGKLPTVDKVYGDSGGALTKWSTIKSWSTMTHAVTD